MAGNKPTIRVGSRTGEIKNFERTLFGYPQTGYAHGGASLRKNFSRGWDWRGGDPRSDIGTNLPTLQQRSRDLWMTSPMGRAAINRIKSHAVGIGLRLQPMPVASMLGLTTDQAAAWARKTAWEWKLWGDSRDCDVAGLNTWEELQALALAAWLQSGDAFATLPMRESRRTPYELKVHLLEADRICNPDTMPMVGPLGWMGTVATAGIALDLLPDGSRIENGVEVDPDGQVVAYWISQVHPLSRDFSPDRGRFLRVPVYDAVTDRLNVVHMLICERPEQHRGVPYLSAIIEPVKQLTRYGESELTAAVVASLFTAFVTSQTSQTPFGEAIPEYEQATQIAVDRDYHYELGPGAVVPLAPGESVSTATPGRPNAAFEAFYKAVAREIGAALDIPYEVLLLEFTASYSASRAAMMAFWKTAVFWRASLQRNFCEPIYREWMYEAVLKGRIDAPGFLEDPALRMAWLGAQWHGPTMGQIDPHKEITAAEKRISLGISTASKESAELNGTIFAENVQQRGVELKMMLEQGLIDPTQIVPKGKEEPPGDVEQMPGHDIETPPAAPTPAR